MTSKTANDELRDQIDATLGRFRSSMVELTQVSRDLATFDSKSVPDEQIVQMHNLITKMFKPLADNVAYMVLATALLSTFTRDAADD